MNNQEYIDALIAKVLSNEATPTELGELEAWKLLSVENLEYYNDFAKLFQFPVTSIHQQFNTEAAWRKVQHEIQHRKPAPVMRNINVKSNWSEFLRVAAVLLFIAGVGFAAYKMMQSDTVDSVAFASTEKIENLSLPDSTQIVLNKNSKLTYAFTKDKRFVELHGEAFFELGADEERPFELLAGNLVIHDIGTSFNVKAHDGSDSVVVQVTEGEVVLIAPQNKSVVLKKGEEALYLKSRDEFIKMAVSDTNAISYKTKIFVFENASLEAVIQKLNDVYGIQIKISDAIRSCHLTATFKDESPDAIVDVIAETLQLEITRENHSITLDGTVCEE